MRTVNTELHNPQRDIRVMGMSELAPRSTGRLVAKIGLADKLQKQYAAPYIIDVRDSTGKRLGYTVPLKMSNSRPTHSNGRITIGEAKKELRKQAPHIAQQYSSLWSEFVTDALLRMEKQHRDRISDEVFNDLHDYGMEEVRKHGLPSRDNPAKGSLSLAGAKQLAKRYGFHVRPSEEDEMEYSGFVVGGPMLPDGAHFFQEYSRQSRPELEEAIEKLKRRYAATPAAVPHKWPPHHNPAADADSAFESFHGEPSSETVIIEDEIHEHEHLWTCGRLMQICVNTQTGMYLELDWEGRPDGEIPYLACSEDGRQLYIEGGDQELDLEAISMDTERWLKDRMVIGEFAPKERGREYNITYRTKKDFDGFEEIDYQHELGESSKELRNPAAPFLEYEPRNKKLYITGGQYIIKKPMFGTSPGIEN